MKILLSLLLVVFLTGCGERVDEQIEGAQGDAKSVEGEVPEKSIEPKNQESVTKSPSSEVQNEGQKSLGEFIASKSDLQIYTLEEIAIHNNPEDCWTVVEGAVADITGFFGSHPGGDSRLAESCGNNATELFKNIRKHNPDGYYELQNWVMGRVGSLEKDGKDFYLLNEVRSPSGNKLFRYYSDDFRGDPCLAHGARFCYLQVLEDNVVVYEDFIDVATEERYSKAALSNYWGVPVGWTDEETLVLEVYEGDLCSSSGRFFSYDLSTKSRDEIYHWKTPCIPGTTIAFGGYELLFDRSFEGKLRIYKILKPDSPEYLWYSEAPSMESMGEMVLIAGMDALELLTELSDDYEIRFHWDGIQLMRGDEVFSFDTETKILSPLG